MTHSHVSGVLFPENEYRKVSLWKYWHLRNAAFINVYTTHVSLPSVPTLTLTMPKIVTSVVEVVYANRNERFSHCHVGCEPNFSSNIDSYHLTSQP